MYHLSKNYLLAIGATAGFLLAVSGVLESPAWSFAGNDNNTVAVVNGQMISAAEFGRYLDAMEQGRQRQLDRDEKRRILQRMIEERLIIERGVDIGLPGSDPLVSKAIRRAMLDTVTAEARAREPDDTELREFLAVNLAYFSRPGKFRVQQILVDAEAGVDASQRAQLALERLRRGESWQQVVAGFGSPALVPLPDQLLPVHKLQQYLGPSLTDIAQQLAVGEYSEALPRGEQQVILRLVETTALEVPEYEDVAGLVKSEYQRRAAMQAEQLFRQRLRAEADIIVNEEMLVR